MIRLMIVTIRKVMGIAPRYILLTVFKILDGRVSAVDEEKEEQESRPLERGGVSHQGPQWWEGGATPLLKLSKIKGALRSIDLKIWSSNIKVSLGT